eukprot:SAG25_NODE_2978_length_1282_cov_1.300422_3_plen_77_part_01
MDGAACCAQQCVKCTTARDIHTFTYIDITHAVTHGSQCSLRRDSPLCARGTHSVGRCISVHLRTAALSAASTSYYAP